CGSVGRHSRSFTSSAWELRPRSSASSPGPDAKQNFATLRSQTGVWERGVRTRSPNEEPDNVSKSAWREGYNLFCDVRDDANRRGRRLVLGNGNGKRQHHRPVARFQRVLFFVDGELEKFPVNGVFIVLLV